MDDFGFLWTFQESVDELKQKLQYVTYELEMTRKQTYEEIAKGNQHIKKLVLMLQNVCNERDEAISQLNKLRQMLAFNNNNKTSLNIHQLIPKPFSPDTPLFSNFHAIANSNITQSSNNDINTFSQPITQSHDSSPAIDSLSYNTPSTISSPDSNNNNSYTNAYGNDSQKPVDRATLMIEKLAKGRPVPKQGELLQAVINAGPLLQTLMVAGSLPRWRNPPGLLTRQIPPVQIKGSTSNSPYYGQTSGGTMGVSPSSMLDFGGASTSTTSASCLVGGRIMPSSLTSDSPTPKRQRLF